MVVVAPIIVVMAPHFILVARALALTPILAVMDFFQLLILRDVLRFPILDLFNVKYAITMDTMPLTISVASIWRTRFVFLQHHFTLMQLVLLLPHLPQHLPSRISCLILVRILIKPMILLMCLIRKPTMELIMSMVLLAAQV